MAAAFFLFYFFSRLPCTLTCFNLSSNYGTFQIPQSQTKCILKEFWIMPIHNSLKKLFHTRKSLWNFQQKVQFFDKAFPPSLLSPLHVVLYVINASFVLPCKLKTKASVLNLSVGSDICWETIACSMGRCRLHFDRHPDTSWHFILTHFIRGAQKKTVLGPEGRKKKLNYSVRCGWFNTHSKFWFVFLNNELCILAVSTTVQALASSFSCVISHPVSATGE